jgi:hypothetical protein
MAAAQLLGHRLGPRHRHHGSHIVLLRQMPNHVEIEHRPPGIGWLWIGVRKEQEAHQ